MGTTKSSSVDDKLKRLYLQLRKAREAGDWDAKIDARLAISDACFYEEPELAYYHFRMAEKVIRNSRKVDRLHEAIGGQGRIHFRYQEFHKAVKYYQAAEKAAKKARKVLAQVRWMLCRASAYRSLDDLAKAKSIVEQAENLLFPPRKKPSLPPKWLAQEKPSFKEMASLFAELEGQKGLNLARENDEEGAEDHYRSALRFAEIVQDWDAVTTWATNVGNVCTRRGRYGQAIECYDKALVAAPKNKQKRAVWVPATQLEACLAQAYRYEEGGDRLFALANAQTDERLKLKLLSRAIQLFDDGLCARKAIKTAKIIESMASDEPVSPDLLADIEPIRQDIKSIRQRMGRLAKKPITPKNAFPPLDIFLPSYMAQAEESGEVEPALQAAYLVCDVRLALALAGDKQLKRLVNGDILESAGMAHRVVLDTLRMLLDAKRVDQALELLQRFKAPAFCIPTLLRLQSKGAPCAEAAAYLDALRELSERVSELAGPARFDWLRLINSVRRAGERLREAGEALRDADPILHARMGGPVRRAELMEAFSYAECIGIVDFVVGPDATMGVVLVREKNGVVVIPIISLTFTAKDAMRLREIYTEGKLPKQLGGAHAQALQKISTILHDHFFCKLAQALSQHGIDQLILIPDLLTRHLPMHLAGTCGREFDIPGIDTKDANFLCQVMPIEYSPCLQAVAASQAYLRPMKIEKIAAFADPVADLPGVRASMEELGSRLGESGAYRLTSGSSFTKAAVSEALHEADVLVLGTHGVFSPRNLKDTHLVMSGESWTMADMVHMPEIDKCPLLVLMACEAGAIALTYDDRNAWGIPGALIAAGGGAVLANIWPVEDTTSDILLEKFLRHLSYPGYRPSAALFRAVRDLRHMTRDEALSYCRQRLELLKEKKAEPRALLGARSIIEEIEDGEAPFPFVHPYFWGGTVIYGSGWHLPAGYLIGPPPLYFENQTRMYDADELLMKGHFRKALEEARRVADCSDGGMRGRAYTTIALALLRTANLCNQWSVYRKAARLLKRAEHIAMNEEDDELRKRVAYAQSQLGGNYVEQKDG